MLDALAIHPIDLLVQRGGESYGGEPVTQLAQAHQCAHDARLSGASDALIVAALLHDIDHLLDPASDGQRPSDASRRGVDLRHERCGAEHLARSFGPAISEPVRMHVEAKRVLARDPSYLAELSPESRRTLDLQGGVMNDEDAEAFLCRPWAREAIALRRWDDAAKDPDREVPDAESYRPLVDAALANS